MFLCAKIDLSPQNKNLKYLDDNKTIIVGKSVLNSDDFDSLVIASRKIRSIKIPSNIKYVKTFAFDGCSVLLRLLLTILKIVNWFQLNEIGFSDSVIEKV